MTESANETQGTQSTLIGRNMSMDITRNIGMLLLSIWLIVHGVAYLIPAVNFEGLGAIMAILAIAAGIFILIKK
jgi:hypothetical protein